MSLPHTASRRPHVRPALPNRVVALFSFLILSLGLPAGLAAQTNLLANPGFETGMLSDWAAPVTTEQEP